MYCMLLSLTLGFNWISLLPAEWVKFILNALGNPHFEAQAGNINSQTQQREKWENSVKIIDSCK